jgi:hypothetical protein
MKTRFASSLRLPLMAGALALVVAGCGSTGRFADRSTESARYPAQSSTPGIPPSIDAYSRSYVPFPASGHETSGLAGHSFYCDAHTSQPGCQSGGDARGVTNAVGEAGATSDTNRPSRY